MTAALGDRMRKLMRQHGINQSQLAARAGTTQPNISKYLAGEREPTSSTLANIATALHTTSEFLLGLPESTPIRRSARSRRTAPGTAAISAKRRRGSSS